MQVLQDVHSAKILELQNKLDNLECTAAAVNTSQQFSHLSPATDHHQREILQDVTNVSVQSSALQICNKPARAQSQLKYAADVISLVNQTTSSPPFSYTDVISRGGRVWHITYMRTLPPTHND